jgi:hypothetical protein
VVGIIGVIQMETLKNEQNLFDELGLEVSQGEVSVGQVVPIFGMITDVSTDTPGSVMVTINYNIVARMNIPDNTKVDLLKEKAFESGIFISKILSKDPKITVECQTVIFGRPQAYHA